MVQFSVGARDFSLVHGIQTSSGAYLASSPMGTGGSFPGHKVAWSETDHLPFPSAEVKSGGAVRQLHSMSSWHGA
jgi:hypothetical protein